jgi:MYXO-CTERM domain-containing protein
VSRAEEQRVDDPVEAYLDQLLVALPGPPRHVRHTLAEVEAHLLDDVAAGRADGLDEAAARSAAVRRVGPVCGVADRPRFGWRLTPALRRRIALATLLIGGVGGIALGIGGIIGRVVQALWGDNAIAVPFPAGSYSPADCARWLAGYPSAHDCVTAMTADHADDFLRNAAAGGVLGLLALGGYELLRRRWTSRAIATALPAGSEDVLGAGLALLSAVVLFGQGVDAVMVTHGNGSGQPFSLALAATLAGAFFARARRKQPHQAPSRV